MKRSLGMQISMAIAAGITLMVTVLISIVASMSYGALVEQGMQEKFNKLGKISVSIEKRYTSTQQTSADLLARIDAIMQQPIGARSRDAGGGKCQPQHSGHRCPL